MKVDKKRAVIALWYCLSAAVAAAHVATVVRWW